MRTMAVSSCGGDAASMGPRSDNRGYAICEVIPELPMPASMGPRSDNRGYVRCTAHAVYDAKLQWVRGRITAVMGQERLGADAQFPLQWVRGPITAVMLVNDE